MFSDMTPQRSAQDLGHPDSAVVNGGPPARLLVVDDEATVTDLLQEFLVSLGYEVEVASSGDAAVARIPVFRPDVVLSDLNMAGLTGLDVMRFSRQTDEETVVILITGETTTAVAIDAMRQGAYDYIIKPFELDDVQGSVERALATRRLRAVNRQLVAELSEKNEILSRHEQELREQRDRFARTVPLPPTSPRSCSSGWKRHSPRRCRSCS